MHPGLGLSLSSIHQLIGITNIAIIPPGLWQFVVICGLPVLMAILGRSKSRPVNAAMAEEVSADNDTTEYPEFFQVTPPPQPFFGRKAELEELVANFERGALIISDNEGLGVGTTALARRLAYTIAKQFPDGCLEVDLFGAMPTLIEPLDPIEAQRRILRAFLPDQDLPEDERDLNKLYRRIFSKKQALLLLDNAAGPGQLRRLIPREPSAVIVTSRTEYPVLAKLYPLKLKGLRPEEAQEMLVGLSPALASFKPRVIQGIAEQFDYMPQALRVIASLFNEPFKWSPRNLSRNYTAAHKRLAALRTSDVNLNTYIALELLYEVLPDKLKPYYEALAIFPAPFTVEEAASVWSIDVETAEKMFLVLRRSSLVEYYPHIQRYDLHALVRMYAQELLLGQRDQTREALSRYAEYVLAEAAQASKQARDEAESGERAGLQKFSQIWPHLWTAWTRMGGIDPGWPLPEQTERWIRDFPVRVLYALSKTLPMDERLPLLERALKAARHLEDRKTEGFYLSQVGRIYAAQGEMAQALACHEQQLQIAYDLHDRYSEADALMHIGLASGALGEVKRAQESWRHAQALFKFIGDPRAAQIQAWLEALDQKMS